MPAGWSDAYFRARAMRRSCDSKHKKQYERYQWSAYTSLPPGLITHSSTESESLPYTGSEGWVGARGGLSLTWPTAPSNSSYQFVFLSCLKALGVLMRMGNSSILLYSF
jgi:hypothetical protein